jgi:hypothetical protein
VVQSKTRSSAFQRRFSGVRLILYCIKASKGGNVTTSDHGYRVYIVRCWEDGEAPEGSASRFVLEIPRTNERYGFTTAGNLLKALQNQLHSPAVSASADKDTASE